MENQLTLVVAGGRKGRELVHCVRKHAHCFRHRWENADGADPLKVDIETVVVVVEADVLLAVARERRDVVNVCVAAHVKEQLVIYNFQRHVVARLAEQVALVERVEVVGRRLRAKAVGGLADELVIHPVVGVLRLLVSRDGVDDWLLAGLLNASEKAVDAFVRQGTGERQPRVGLEVELDRVAVEVESRFRQSLPQHSLPWRPLRKGEEKEERPCGCLAAHGGWVDFIEATKRVTEI